MNNKRGVSFKMYAKLLSPEALFCFSSKYTKNGLAAGLCSDPGEKRGKRQGRGLEPEFDSRFGK